MRYRMEQERQGRRNEKEVQLELRTSSLLILLGVLAVVCGLFYALGYTIGLHSAPQTFSLNPSPPQSAPRLKPSSRLMPGGAHPPNPIELSAAEQGNTPATLTPAPTPVSTTAPAATTPIPAATAAPAPVPAQKLPAAAIVPTSASSTAHTFVVQVFAGVNRSDAFSLAAALKARQYPVFVVSPPAGHKYYRVQIGPYPNTQLASAMRARLQADGYNAVVKPRS